MRFGIREVADVVLRAKSTIKLGSRTFYKNEPILYFDTLKTSSLEGAATTVYATGGRGNPQLIGWDGERTLTMNMEDALISPESFAILSGADLIGVTEDTPIYVHTTSQIEVKKANTIELPEEACWNKYNTEDEYYHRGADIFVMTMTNGQIDNEPCIPYAVADNHKTLTCYSHSGQIDVGDIVLVDYYVKRIGGSQLIEITADKFGGNYYLEASALFRDEATGVDMPAEFVIPNCKVQSNFTFSMANSGDPSTFSFVLDCFPDYTKFDQTHKVLAALQVITEAVDTADEERKACVMQDVTAITDGISVTFDNDSTEDNCKLTVVGSNINGTTYSKEWWGDKLPNAAELDIIMPITENGKYRLTSQNPALKYYADDPNVTSKNGIYTKSQVIDVDDGSLTVKTVVTEDKGAILIKLFDEAGNLMKTFSINNKVSFLKSYPVEVNNTSTVTVDNKILNEDSTNTDFTRVVTGDRICLTLSGSADVTSIGSTVTNDGNIYTVTVGNPATGTVKIDIKNE